MRRLYVATTIAGVGDLLESGAVAPTSEPFEADGDDEGAEYAALMSAADASAALLDGPGRRVVLVAEVAGAVDLAAPVALGDLVAVHADVTERGPDADPDEDLAWFGVQEIDVLL